MSEFLQIFEYTFFRNALFAALLISVISAFVGTYIVSRKIVFISGGITHSSFGGIGMAYFLGMNPIMGAGIFAVISAILIEWISSRGKIREDSAIAILWSLGMALGIIFVFMTPGYSPNLMSFLFGSILSVTTNELYLMLAFAVFIALFFILFFRPIISSAFDPEYSGIMGVNVAFFRYSMSVIIGVAIVLSIRSVGIILVLSLMTIPQITAMLFTRNFARIIPLAALLGGVGSTAGLFASYYLDIPSGAAIIFFLTLLFLFFKAFVSARRYLLKTYAIK